MSVSTAEASAQADALEAAAAASPVRQVRYDLSRQAREWRSAAAFADGDGAVIEMAGTVCAGMLMPTRDGNVNVRRSFPSNGGWTLHLEDADGRPAGTYENYAGPTSPVVVCS